MDEQKGMRQMNREYAPTGPCASYPHAKRQPLGTVLLEKFGQPSHWSEWVKLFDADMKASCLNCRNGKDLKRGQACPNCGEHKFNIEAIG
jgi:hypothetical protein